MTHPPRGTATYADILQAPPHALAQIVDGELHLQPHAPDPHLSTVRRLCADIGAAFDRAGTGPGGWIVLDMPEIHLGLDVVVTDVAGWRRERPPNIEDEFFTVAPAWVCEVLSATSATLDRGSKADLYARVGVEFMWLVEPNAKQIEAYRREQATWLRLGVWSSAVSARIPPFDAVALELGPLWTKQNPNLSPR